MNLKRLRTSANITQLQLAKVLNISQQNLCRYETGQNEPDIETLKKIADYFDVSLDFLCDRPRPYDIPSTTTIEQKELIKIILSLDREQCMLVNAYIEGLKTGKRKQEETIKRLKGN